MTVIASQLERVRDLCSEHGVHTVECAFPDTWGVLRGKRLPTAHFLKIAERGFALANAAYIWDLVCDIFPVEFANPDTGYPDMLAVPDLATLRPISWREGTALCMVDTVDEHTREPIPLDPRELVRRQVERLRELGYEPVVATELEFYLCDADWQPLYDTVQCYSIGKGAELEAILVDVRRTLEAFGIYVEACNTEYGPAQVEINLAPGDALQVADDTAIFKHVVKEVARRHGARATFMAKPFPGFSGNGLHVHQSLRALDGDDNLFALDDLDAGPLRSSLMRRYLSGLLAHQRELTAINCPTINSYKRVEDYSFAPTCVTWGLDNRSVAVRTMPGHGPATRLEARGAAADASPHLVIAGCLAAGADGLAGEHPLPDYTPGDAYVAADVPRLPISLGEALSALEAGSFCRAAFGDVFVDNLLALGRHELEVFGRQVTEWERQRYIEVV